MTKNISRKKHWVSRNAWRGYEEPLNAVAGANDTGTWSDSPCPSGVCKAELRKVKQALKANGIRYATMTCRSSNVFCAHRYILVDPENKERAKELIEPLIKETRLLYPV